MTHSLIEMTEDEFDARYPLRTNHLNPHASWRMAMTAAASSRPTARSSISCGGKTRAPFGPSWTATTAINTS